MGSTNIKKLEITRKIVQVITILVSVGLITLAIFAPWSSERIVEDYGSFGSSYTVYHYNIYFGLACFLPAIASLVINGSLKRYFKRYRAGTVPPIRVSPTETVSIAQNSSNKQQLLLAGSDDLRYCIACGESNDFVGSFCKYCGTQLQNSISFFSFNFLFKSIK